MRRSDKALPPEAAEEVLRRGVVAYLAMCGGGEPYVVPVNYGYRDGRLYFHCAEEGCKLDKLAMDPRVHLVVTADVAIVPGQACTWGTRFLSVMAKGVARRIHQPEEKAEALSLIIEHYAGRPEPIDPADTEGTAVVCIELESVTGKTSL